MELIVSDKGLVEYGEMLELQRRLFSEMVNKKRDKFPVEKEYLLLVEHKPVITLGKHADTDNLLLPEDVLHKRGVGLFHIERGGDVTYHGPGQLVVYPLIDLEAHRLGVKDYVSLLEEVVIRTLAAFGIDGKRVSGASGVWLGTGTSTERKICALGVKCSRFITMHGLALNVTTDLDGFRMINPCGFVDKAVTSMQKELGYEPDMPNVKKEIVSNFRKLLSSQAPCLRT